MLQQRDVIVANCCVWNYTPARLHSVRVNWQIGVSFVRYQHLFELFVHIKYTSNMVAYQDNDKAIMLFTSQCIGTYHSRRERGFGH